MMFTASVPFSRLGPTDRPCLHTYYDICPEDPASGRVLASVFAGDRIPGPCRVALLDHEGAVERMLGEPGAAIGHTGRFAVWLDERRVGYALGPRHRVAEMAEGWCIHDLKADTVSARPATLRQWHRGTQRGLLQCRAERPNPHGLLQGFGVCDGDGALQVILDVDDCAEACPPAAGVPDDHDLLNVQNLKWSPDGSTFFLVFTSEGYRRSHPDADLPFFKCLVAFDADGGNGRWLGGFGHHPAWTPDGARVIAFSRKPDGGQDLMAYDPAGGGGTTVLLEDAPGTHGHLLDDGSFLTDVHDWQATDRGGVVRIDLATGARSELASFPHTRWHHADGHHIHPVPTPDFARVYLNAEADGRCGLYRLEHPRP